MHLLRWNQQCSDRGTYRFPMQSGRVGEAPAERGSLSEYFPSIPIMAALMGKPAPSESPAGSATAGSSGFKGFALVWGLSH